MNVMFTSKRCGLRSPRPVQTTANITQSVAGTFLSTTQNAGDGRKIVPCVFVAQEFPVPIRFKTQSKLAMEFAGCPAANRLPADGSCQTKTNWKGGES
jgi:hypothetical protein